MNFSTFFIDKLNGTSPELSLGKKKNLIDSYMFSDIIKVCEDESVKKEELRSSSEINPQNENIIQVSTDDLSGLFQFINSFIISNQEIQSTESNYLIDSTEINKKQFVVDEGQLTHFINELANKISSNSKTVSIDGQNDFCSKELSVVFKTDSGKITLNITPLKKVNTEDPIVIDKLLESLQYLMSNNKRNENLAATNNFSNLFSTDDATIDDVNKNKQVDKNNEEIGTADDKLNQKLFYKAEVIQILDHGKNDSIHKTLSCIQDGGNSQYFVDQTAASSLNVGVSSSEKLSQIDCELSSPRVRTLMPGNNSVIINSEQEKLSAAPTGKYFSQKMNADSNQQIFDKYTADEKVNSSDIPKVVATGGKLHKPINIFPQNNTEVNKLLKELAVNQVSVTSSNQPVFENKSGLFETVVVKSNPQIKLEESGVDVKKTESTTGKLEIKVESNNEYKSNLQEAFDGLKKLEQKDLNLINPSKGYINIHSDGQPIGGENILSNDSTVEKNKEGVIQEVSNDLENLEKYDLNYLIPSKGYKNIQSGSKPIVDENILSNDSTVEKNKEGVIQEVSDDLKNLETYDLDYLITHKEYKNTQSGSKPVIDEDVRPNAKNNDENKIIVKVSSKPTIKISNENNPEAIATALKDKIVNEKNNSNWLRTADSNLFSKQPAEKESIIYQQEKAIQSQTAGKQNTINSGTRIESKSPNSIATTETDFNNVSEKEIINNNIIKGSLGNETVYDVNIKQIRKEDSVDEKKGAQSVEKARPDNDKQEKQSLRDTDFNRQENKDQNKNTAYETLKNSVQQMQKSNVDFDSEKNKIFSDLSRTQETIKNIRANDLIPEFSKLIVQGEKQSITFQLSPENLGKVKLSIDLVNNQISTRIEVENEQIKQFIQSNIEQLKHNLQLEGIKYNSVNISLANYDQRPNKSFVQKKKYSSYGNKEQIIEELVNVPLKKMGYNTYEYLA